MPRYLLFSVGLLLTAFSTAMPTESQPAPLPRQAEFFDPAVRPTPVFTGGVGTVCEGPAVAADGRVFFTDITPDDSGGLLWVYDPATGQTQQLRRPSGNASGLAFDAAGRLVVAEGPNRGGGKRISRLDLATGQMTLLADIFQGQPLNGPNDLTLDAQGRVYFTDSRYSSTEPLTQPWMGIYRLVPGQPAELLAPDLTRPNGLVFAPDRHTLYVGSYDSPGLGVYGPLPAGYAGPLPQSVGELRAYPVQPDGQRAAGRTLVRFTGEGPDGLTVDAEGNLYAAVASRLVVFSPQGERLAEMPLPAKTTNLCFGHGSADHTLYITVAKGLYTLPTRKAGWPLPGTGR